MADPTPAEVAAAHETLYKVGVKLRREVAGAAHVERSLAANDDDFLRPMQELATEAGWGSVWIRPGLERKFRSLLCVGMLVALGRGTELAVHLRGAFNNGATKLEVREALLQSALYCGMPAAIEGFRVAKRVVEEMEKEKGQPLE